MDKLYGITLTLRWKSTIVAGACSLSGVHEKLAKKAIIENELICETSLRSLLFYSRGKKLRLKDAT